MGSSFIFFRPPPLASDPLLIFRPWAHSIRDMVDTTLFDVNGVSPPLLTFLSMLFHAAGHWLELSAMADPYLSCLPSPPLALATSP